MNEIECAICLDKLFSSDVIILPCKHIYHKSCFYNNIKINGYKCPYRCVIDIMDDNTIEKLSYFSSKYIEKLTKRVILPNSIERILKRVNWKENNVFIAGGFALSLYNNFIIPYSDIDIMCTDLNAVNFTEFLLNGDMRIEDNRVKEEYMMLNSDYTILNNNIEKVIKIKNNYNNNSNNNLDIVKLIDDKIVKKNKLTILIHDTLERFDLSCCKIACTYHGDDNFVFYIHPDYYNNVAYLHKDNTIKRNNTLNRIAKYNKKGIKNIKIVEI